MYMLAVCDDQPVHAERIRKAVMAQLAVRNVPATVDTYISPVNMKKRLLQGNGYDAYFLDIDMPGLDGISLCRCIRQIKGDALVVFISNKEEMVFQVFEVAPFRFVRKSRFEAELGSVIRDLLTELDRRAACWLRLEDERQGTLYSVNLRQLMYVQAMRKQCRLCSSGESIELTMQFGTLVRYLQPNDFILIHRSYIVNLRFLHRINNDTIMLDNRQELPLSRSRRQTVRDAFFAWNREGT